MTARFEIVRTSAPQPWHVRLVSNGRVILSSESYSRQIGAEGAVLTAARAFGIDVDHLAWNVKGVEKVLRDRWCHVVDGAPLVKYIDERPRPLTMDDLEAPYYFCETNEYARVGRRTVSTRVPFWHDHEYHYRNCFDSDCAEGEPPKGTSVCGRFGRVVMR